jgi:hypothetical protein
VARIVATASAAEAFTACTSLPSTVTAGMPCEAAQVEMCSTGIVSRRCT